MRLSSKGDYGIRALVDLAQHDGRGPIPSSEIAGRQGIPESLVGQVLGLLRLGGFVRSVRGAQGGHQLVLPAGEIRMHDVVESLEGSISVGACLDHPNLDCSGSSGQLRMWEDVRDAIVGVLSDRTLADLAQQDSVAPGGRYSI
jgi:Rrf2 family cysteine metabolism transcriptional repressor